ncbi:MAG: hypothetical protein WCJ07_14405 [Verrucomicrobiota bacterium]
MSIRPSIGQYIQSRTERVQLVANENAVARAVRLICSPAIGERYCVFGVDVDVVADEGLFFYEANASRNFFYNRPRRSRASDQREGREGVL